LTRHFRQLTRAILLTADVVAVVDPTDPSRRLPLYPPPAATRPRATRATPRLLLVEVDRRYRDEQVHMLRESLVTLRTRPASPER
jgi:hypothetical protein